MHDQTNITFSIDSVPNLAVDTGLHIVGHALYVVALFMHLCPDSLSKSFYGGWIFFSQWL